MNTTQDFYVITPVGKTVFTSPDKPIAKRWADENADVFPGIMVIEVTTTVIKRRIYRPRPMMGEVAA